MIIATFILASHSLKIETVKTVAISSTLLDRRVLRPGMISFVVVIIILTTIPLTSVKRVVS